jgi:hypothetical protein
MDIKRILVDYLDAKRPEMWQGLTAKLGVLILIAVVPGGLPLALSAYLYQRSKRAASAAPAHRRRATALGNGASAFDKVYRTLGHWE